MMFNIVVFGAPCSGKGTQSERIADKYTLIHISTGELFRNEIKKKTKIGLLAQSYIDRGELVPDEVVLKEIYLTATKRKNNNGFVFDGFPRTLQQAQTLDKSLANKGLEVGVVVFIDVEEKELVNRMLNRSKDSERTDDSMDVITKRIKVYKEQTLPLIKYYEQQNKLLTVSGMDSIENVFSKIVDVVENYKKTHL